MSTVKASATTRPELEVHSPSSASASSASPSMGQSGELITYSESTDAESDHDKHISSLARNAAKVHDSLPEVLVPPVPEYYASIPSAPALTPLSPEAVEVDPIGTGLKLHDMRSQHHIADHSSAPVTARSGTQPPPGTAMPAAAKVEHRSAPVTASERENVSGPLLDSEATHMDKTKKADRDPLDQFGAEIDAQSKAYIFTHGVPSSLYHDNSTPTPEHSHHRAPSNTFVGAAVAVAGDEHDFPDDSEAVKSGAPVPQSAICDDVEGVSLSGGSGDGNKAKGEGAGDRHARDAMAGSGEAHSGINGHNSDGGAASAAAVVGLMAAAHGTSSASDVCTKTDNMLGAGTAIGAEKADALKRQLSTPSSNVKPSAAGGASPVSDKASVKTTAVATQPRTCGDGNVRVRAVLTVVASAISATLFKSTLKCPYRTSLALACAWFAVLAINTLKPGTSLRAPHDWADLVLDTTSKVLAVALVTVLLN